MKICQLSAIDVTLKKQLLPLVDEMINQGWKVHCICSHGQYIDDLREQGYDITTTNISRSFNPFKHLITITKLYKIFKKERFDVVHVHTPVASLVGRLAAYFSGTSLVIYTAHGFYFHDEMHHFKRWFFIFLEKIFGLITDFIFTQSKEDFLSAIRKRIIKKDKILCIGNGVDIERFNPSKYLQNHPLKLSLGIPENAFVVGMICRLVKEKGIEDFLEAAKILHSDNPEIYFMLVGERVSSEHSESVEKIIEHSKLELRDNLILTGLRSDIPELISIMNLFCLPSWREGMPRTIIEAMMMQKPVVATNIRGSREEVVDEVTGFLVPTHNEERLARAIKKIYANPSLALNMGIAGREKALKNYDESKIIALQINKIKELFQAAD